MARLEGLHLIRKSRVVANDVANLVSRVRIVVCIGNSTWRYKWWFVTGWSHACIYELWLVDGGTTSCGL